MLNKTEKGRAELQPGQRTLGQRERAVLLDVLEPRAVERHAQVTVRALGRDGKPFEMTVDGLAAICVQHEMDHLLGKVFVEYLSPLKRNRIKTRMLKQQREDKR